jgi:lysylphosphatidylglycerol synthetase-like protein (DUF2156 family)
MRPQPSWLDRGVRAALGAPGWILERLEPGVEAPPSHPASEALRAQVRDHAHWPEAQLCLEPDMQVHEHDGAVLGFQVRGATAFGIGGLNTSAPTALLRSFAAGAAARRHLVFPIRAHELDDTHAAGFGTVQVGVEAWLDLEGRDWRGNRFEHVRHMRNRATRVGVVSAEVDPATVEGELEAVYEAWLSSKRPSWRMKLLVGSPGLGDPGDRRYIVAATPGRVEAFITLLPGASGQWGVDVICRRPDAVPGCVEHVILHAVSLLRAEGAQTLSLGPCPMAGVEASGLLSGIFRFLYRSQVGNRLFGFQRLYTFKAKFRPRWEPVYFAASPRLGLFELYAGCRMWGLY